MSTKIKSLADLRSVVADAKRRGRTVVFTNGCFDLLHRGHLQVLRAAKECGDILIVALNSDRSVKALKGPRRPIVPENERAELIAALEMVDYVTVFDEPDPYRLIENLRPDVLAKGGDWNEDTIVGADIVREGGGRVAVIPYVQGFSTTDLIERIRS